MLNPKNICCSLFFQILMVPLYFKKMEFVEEMYTYLTITVFYSRGGERYQGIPYLDSILTNRFTNIHPYMKKLEYSRNISKFICYFIILYNLYPVLYSRVNSCCIIRQIISLQDFYSILNYIRTFDVDHSKSEEL